MRPTSHQIFFLLLLACGPETRLDNQAALVPAKESTRDELSSPARDPESGRLIVPADGARQVPTNLARLWVQFPEAVRTVGEAAAFTLAVDLESPLVLQLGDPLPCEGSCYELVLGSQLVASASYTLAVVPSTLEFFDGKPVPGGNIGTFTTGATADLFAPRIVSFSVAVVESCVSIQLAADEIVRLDVTISAGEITRTIPAGVFGKTFDFSRALSGLSPSQKAQAIAFATDLAGNKAQSSPVLLDLPPSLPAIVITEVLANPAGSESTQEWVEIYNAGNEPVALGGMFLADKAGSDALPSASLPPGGYALIVPEKFDPASILDTRPREETLLLRISGRLAGDGLSNTGEPVRLLSHDGYVISKYGGWVDASASAWSGKSVKRSGLQTCDADTAWSHEPGPATPGW